MKTRIIRILAVAFLALPGMVLAAQDEDVEQAIRSQRERFVIAVNARDFEEALSLCAADAVMYVELTDAIERREALGSVVRRMSERRVNPDLDMMTTRLEISGSLAYELGRYRKVYRHPDGSSRQSHGKYVDVWRLEHDGQWRIVVHAPSADPEPEEARQP